ncbi:MAG: ATP-binding cassette domain-containing protein [Defluviitaleaceae bacterium]|nr:ATP-binding cassette domain-containing protein [Defluviitaleaceae bacterium]
MLIVENLSLRFGGRKLFDSVNLKFVPGNCYGIIGANGAGKSTFLRILSGELEPTTGEVILEKGRRMSVLKQDHYAFDDYSVQDTVIIGNPRLYEIMKEKDALYLKPDFDDNDGLKAAELEGEFAAMNGWEAESDSSKLLQSLSISEEKHHLMMKDLDGQEKVRVFLAQALFGNPDVLVLDEPTNDLDIKSIAWFEEFLINYEGVVIVVSHDRHFLNNVCTYVADVDFGQIKLFTGNYDFWYQSSQLMLSLVRDQNRKKEEKIKELQKFIQRFSANASKSRQATSRKKLLDKIAIEEIQPSNRRYPFIFFKPEREAGNDILMVENLSKAAEGNTLFENLTLTAAKGEKIAFIGSEHGISALFRILAGEDEANLGNFKYGITITYEYFPKDNSEFFEDCKLNLVDWMRQFSKDDSENYIRGFLGKMLFSGEEALKNASVLSGGERVRCMFAKMMMTTANFLIFDQPTNHLDLESITALNNAMTDFNGNILFTTHDRELIQTVANRVIEIKEDGSFEDKTDMLEDFQGE